ncbi:MAG: DUF4168 domain-containing protein [Rhizobiales bacterium]|nr:DUF4168 domain-containing protein [Hyphomicrobiales bacterium]
MQGLVRRLLFVAGGVLSASWLLSAPAADARVQHAQAQAPSDSEQSPDASDQKQAPDLSDQKLDAVAAALEQVANVRQGYQERIESAPPSEGESIAEEGKGALVKAITDQGLSVEEYVSILVVAQNDPAVREKIVKRIRSSPK